MRVKKFFADYKTITTDDIAPGRDGASKLAECFYFCLKNAKFLENRLAATFDYIEPDGANYGAYSQTSREIILQACIQIEVLAKNLLDVFCLEGEGKAGFPKLKPKDSVWKKLFTLCSQKSKDILYGAIGVDFVPYKNKAPRKCDGNFSFVPWKLNEGLLMPDWWIIYNGIKHDGGNDLAQFTYMTAVKSLGGLYAFIAFAKSTAGAGRLAYDPSFVSEYFEILPRKYNFWN
ncbi:MAG: hypothetical protein LBL21_00910 [Rickettsiales bacterium]|jgi:hypothetical protein|nr:hypothetical protein [Rickettsiales bacterium]